MVKLCTNLGLEVEKFTSMMQMFRNFNMIYCAVDNVSEYVKKILFGIANNSEIATFPVCFHCQNLTSICSNSKHNFLYQSTACFNKK